MTSHPNGSSRLMTGMMRVCAFAGSRNWSLLRLITTEVMGKHEVLSERQAWDVYDRWFEDSRVFFLQEGANLEKMFRGISKQARPAAKDWVHSELLAFAEVADLSLVAFDRAIKQKDGSALLLQ